MAQSKRAATPVNEVVDDFPPVDDDVDLVEDDDNVFDGDDQAPGAIVQLDQGTDMGPQPDNTENLGDGRFDRQRLPHEPQPANDTTNTKNYMGDNERTLAEWQSLGDEVEVESITVRDMPKTKTFKLRVMEDIGPVFYGLVEVDMKKGVLYEVPDYIEEYLRTRGKIWSYA